MADLKDKLIGGFRILAEIKGASGSQGQIFKAVCEKPPFAGIEPGTVVALKAMAVHDEDGRAWAKLEKRTSELVRLSHPNVVKYYGCFSESGTFNDIHAIVQEYLDGETLKQRLARCPSGLDADEALRITGAALAGLEYTAANKIVHRDVKPGNIFLCSDGSVKLIDFEIAHQEGGTTTSASGNLVGSFDYMAPDFTNSTFRGDERSDVFSMGVVMHEVITGRTPYQRIEGGGGQANFAFLTRWARLHVDGTNPIRISARANRLLAHSNEVLEKALAPLAENRYESFAAFHAGLKAIRYRDLRNGEKVYRILQIIGKGGFGEVFKARLKGTKRFVAIKHLLKAAYAQRFYREAKIMAKLHDPCFVQFIDFFEIPHSGSREAFLVMDFLPGMPGSSLRDAIKRAGGASLPFRETLLAFARFAHGLSMIHARGIFHRDIKPSNLYYPEGHPERAAIMDLGIARDIHGSVTSGQVPGTLDYMPPEVVLSDNRGEAGMDIYALGLCLYEALTGMPAYPRLPQGAAAYTAFFARAKIKAMPDLSDPAVVANAPLHELLVRMTHPELSERIVDTQAVERRLAELARVDLPSASSQEDDDVEEQMPATQTVASFEDGEEDAADPGTHGTIATVSSLVTGATSESNLKAIKEESRRVWRNRLLRGLAYAASVVAVCGAAWAFKGPFVGWLQGRAASDALKEANDRVFAAYDRQGLEAGHRAEADWFSRWTPGRGRWVDIDEESFTVCTNRIRAAEVKLLDVAAESAANEVVKYYESANALTACDEKRAMWRTNWAERCSTGKFGELENIIQGARDKRIKLNKKSKWDGYISRGHSIALAYDGTNTLAYCDDQAKKWRNEIQDNGGSPDDPNYKRVVARMDSAHHNRVRKENKKAAESELGEVLKAYARSTADGDEKAERWRKSWKEKLSSEDFSEWEKRIALAQNDSKTAEHKRLVAKKQKECGDERLPILAGYKDDSSKKADVDAKYGEWVKKWKDDRDLPIVWLTSRLTEVAEEKRMREERIDAAMQEVKKAAHEELQVIVDAYGGPMNDRADCDKQAKKWRKKWQGKLDAGAFSEMNAQIESARQKRGDREKWEEEQRVLASKTNEVESVCAELVGEYGNDVGQKKAEIDSRFDSWTKKWESDKVLQKNLPDWFAGRKRTVATAKSSCEARIAEARRIQLFTEKTNEVVTVRKQLENGYKADASDKAKLDEKFTEWVRKWSLDTHLPPGWFDVQRQAVEQAQAARKARDERKRQEQKAGKEADSVCETYRTDGVAVGDGSRKMWNNAWTNALESTVFQSLSQKIDKARVKRVEEEMEQQAREESKSVCEVYRGSGVTAGDDKRREWSNKWNNKLAVAPFRELSQTIDKVRAEVAKDQEGILASKTNDVVSVCAELVRNYGNDAVKKSEIDSRFAKWAQDWENDVDLRKSLPNWFAGQRKIVETARVARENRIKQRMAQIETERKGLEDGYRDDSSDKAKLDAKFDKWSKDWDKEVDLTSDWLAEQMAAVKSEKSARERRETDRERARVQANLVCDSYRKSGVAAGDGSRAMWINNWTNVLGEAVFNELSREIDRARADASVAFETPKPKPGDPGNAPPKQVVAAKQNEAGRMRKQLEDGYKTDTADKADLDRKFAEWTAKWKADADLPSGWFAEQMIAVEREKMARERRDEDRKRREQDRMRNVRQATERAESVCKLYDRSGVTVGDEYRDEWIRSWTNVLDAAVFHDLSGKIGEARAKRKALDDQMVADEDKERIEKKQNLARADAESLVRAYGNAAIARTETDRSFVAWRDKWGTDTDLSADWVADHRKKVEKAQADRIAREVAEKNRKEAWDAVVRVCEEYASGVEGGDSARQIWEGKWKPILDEATYKNISAIIDKDRRKAVEKAEEARRKAERERLEKDVRAKLSVDRDHVERWKGQLADAEQKIAKGKASGVLDAQNAATLQGEIDQRKKWVVGVVVNQSQYEIEVARRPIKPGQRELFEFRGTMPVGGLLVTSAGYKPVTIDEKALDCSVVQIGVGKWKLEQSPKAWVQIPKLEDGVTCYLDGVVKSSGDKVEVDSGKELRYVYSRKGHEDQKGTFTVQGGEQKRLPIPGEWRVASSIQSQFEDRVEDAKACIQEVERNGKIDFLGDGDLCLETYHEIWREGYRLKSSDFEYVEAAYKICEKDYPERLRRAKWDVHFKEEDVRTWWKKIRGYYTDLTGKRVAVEDESR